MNCLQFAHGSLLFVQLFVASRYLRTHCRLNKLLQIPSCFLLQVSNVLVLIEEDWNWRLENMSSMPLMGKDVRYFLGWGVEGWHQNWELIGIPCSQPSIYWFRIVVNALNWHPFRFHQVHPSFLRSLGNLLYAVLLVRHMFLDIDI